MLHETKNRERRSVPVTGTALDVLRERAKVRRIDTDLVFANRYGKAPFPRQAWDRALREAGLDDFTFHDLRHTAASYLAMSGATLAEIAEVLGHRTLAMVKRYDEPVPGVERVPKPSLDSCFDSLSHLPRLVPGRGSEENSLA